MKKFFAILMVAVMVLSLSTVAFAAAVGSVELKAGAPVVGDDREAAKDAAELTGKEKLGTVYAVPAELRGQNATFASNVRKVLYKNSDGNWALITVNTDGTYTIPAEAVQLLTVVKKSSGSSSSSSDVPTSPQTGEMMPVVAMVGALSFAAAAAYTLRKAKRA